MKNQSFNEIINDLKGGTIKNVVLLYGVEEFLVSWSKDMLIDKYVSEATRSMDLITFEPGEFGSNEMYRLEEACSTFPMFSERKVVVVEGYKDAWNSKSDFLADYVKAVPDHVLLIITVPEPEPDKRKYKHVLETKLKKEIEKLGNVYNFAPLSEDALKKFIIKRVQGQGKVISQPAVNTLMQHSGYLNNEIDYALYNLENDIKKMAALAKGNEITEEDVVRAVSDNVEHNVFKMLDSISSNNKEAAFKLLSDMIRSGKQLAQILSTISRQLELMLMVKELEQKGFNKFKISKEIKVHEYKVQKAMGFARSYSVKDLKRITKMAYDIDYQHKSGLLDTQLGLEMLIASI